MIYVTNFKSVPFVRDSDETADLQKAIIQAFKRFVPEAKESVWVDCKDFFECAIQLYEAERLGLDIELCSEVDGGLYTSSSLEGIREYFGEKSGADVVIGNGMLESFTAHANANLNLIRPNQEQYLLGLDYPTLSCLANKHFNRKNAMGSFQTGNPNSSEFQRLYKANDYLSVLWSMYQEGSRDLFLKVSARSKYCNAQIHLPDELISKDELFKHIPEDIGWASVHLEGSDNAIHISEVAKIRAEYRMVVLDGKIVTGAGCIESATPLDNNGNAFDNRVENIRNEGEFIELSSSELNQYKCYAEEVIRDIQEERPDVESFILDIGYINGKTGVIEINPLHRFGLYAMNSEALIKGYQESVTKNNQSSLTELNR